LPDPPLKTRESLPQLIALVRQASGSSDAAQRAQRESARRMPTTTDTTLLDGGQVLLAQQERLERSGHRIDVQRDQEPVEHIGTVHGFDFSLVRDSKVLQADAHQF
jgi:hypothetical protein